MKRQIITIDEDRCTGCGLCIPNCPEGAMQIIDGKARLVSDLFCDGLGACIGHCPEDAINIEEREAEPYDERKTMENIARGGREVIAAHLAHLSDHGQDGFLEEALEFLREKNMEVPEDGPEAVEERTVETTGRACGCPGSMAMDFRGEAGEAVEDETVGRFSPKSRLGHWPVQLRLLSPYAPYFRDADLLVTADCVPFAQADFHERFLKGKVLVIFCPKLDESTQQYIEKLAEILEHNTVRSLTMVHMEVPCCFGLKHIVEEALKKSGKAIATGEVVVSIKGEARQTA